LIIIIERQLGGARRGASIASLHRGVYNALKNNTETSSS